MKRLQLTQAVVQELLTYDASTGRLWWTERAEHWFSSKAACARWNARYAGRPAFTSGNTGRRVGCIEGYPYLAHRVIWLYVYGYLPETVRFKDGDACNLRLANLYDPEHQAGPRVRLAA